MEVPYSTLIVLCALIVHADEYADSEHPVDRVVFKGLMESTDVKHILGFLDSKALLPIRRDGIRYKDR